MGNQNKKHSFDSWTQELPRTNTVVFPEAGPEGG